MKGKIYSSRSAAVRAARNACRKALGAPEYQAAEGPDYIIQPVSWNEHPSIWAGDYCGPSRYEIRGPALEANK